MSRVSPPSGLQGWGLMNALPKSFEKKSMLQNSIRLAAFWHDHTIWHTEWTFVTEAWWFSFYVFRPLSMLPVHHNSALLWRSQQTAKPQLHPALSALTWDRCYYKRAFCTEWRMPSRQSISPRRKITGDSMGRIVSLSQNENLERANLEQPKRVMATEWGWMNWMILAALMLADVSSIKKWNSPGDEWRALVLQWLRLRLVLTRLIV